MEKDKLLEVRNIIGDIVLNGISEEYIKELYRILGNKKIPLVFNDFGFNIAAFNPKFMNIRVNVSKCNEWASQMIDESLPFFDIYDEELLKSYLFIGLLCHEIEHSNQKLIALGKKEANYEFKKDVYHDIFEVLRLKRYIVPRPISLSLDATRFIIYKKNAYDFILERNASVEGYNVASQIAKEADDSKVLDYLIAIRNAFMLQGYVQTGEGSLKYTYRKLGLMKKYNKLDIPINIPLSEKIREGLELDEEERRKAVLALKQNIHFK